MKKVLVTGGAGFIGSHLVDVLLATKYHVVVLDNFSSGSYQNLAQARDNPRLSIFEGDVRSSSDIENAIKGCNIVFHLAVDCVRHSINDPIENHEINATGTLNVLDFSRKYKVERFIYCSSSEVYGNASTELLYEDKTMCSPVTVYGSSKLVGEYYAKSYWQTYKLPVVIIRPFNAYGPRCHLLGKLAEVIPRFALCLMQDKQPIIFGNPYNGRDFTYVTDIAKALMLSAQKEHIIGEVINVAFGKMITVKEIAEILNEKLDKKLGTTIGIERPGDVYQLRADVSKATELLNYKAEIGFNAGINMFITWLKDTISLKNGIDIENYNW